MSRLRFPLGGYLVDPVDEAAIQRMGDEIDAHFPRRRPRRLAAILVATTAVLAAGIAVLGGRRDAGPLRLADGRLLTTVQAASNGTSLALSDGSRIDLQTGARLETLETSGLRFVAMLASGSGDFDVRPNGPRRWLIECGLASVEVVGTRFACERGPSHLRVSVTRGTVIVRGERVPDRARRLLAGESLTVQDEIPHSDPPAAAPPTIARPAEPPLPSLPAPARERALPRANREAKPPSWQELARSGRTREAFDTLGADGLRKESRRLGVDDLLALADVARLSGHPTDAVAPLQRVLNEFASDAQAPLAAFALGRLELDSLERPGPAVSALKRALALGIPQSLKEDVLARLVEAHVRAGEIDDARKVADTYAREFPHGRHALSIRNWLFER